MGISKTTIEQMKKHPTRKDDHDTKALCDFALAAIQALEQYAAREELIDREVNTMISQNIKTGIATNTLNELRIRDARNVLSMLSDQ